MKELLYEWVRNIVFYQLIVSIIINMMPKDTYQKYIRFFLGILFIVIATKPVFELFHLAESMDVKYVQGIYEELEKR